MRTIILAAYLAGIVFFLINVLIEGRPHKGWYIIVYLIILLVWPIFYIMGVVEGLKEVNKEN